jgi:hypothetical protein
VLSREGATQETILMSLVVDRNIVVLKQRIGKQGVHKQTNLGFIKKTCEAR